MPFSFPCHPREIRTLRTVGTAGVISSYTVPAGKIWVLTALGVTRPAGTSLVGLIAPMATLYANDIVVLRGSITGYISNEWLNLREQHAPMTMWSKVPKGISFPAGTVLKVGAHDVHFQ